MQKLRDACEKSFRGYADILRRQGNSVVDRFVSHLLADEERRFQLEVMEQAFAKSFEMIAKFEEKATFELIEAEKQTRARAAVEMVLWRTVCRIYGYAYGNSQLYEK